MKDNEDYFFGFLIILFIYIQAISRPAPNPGAPYQHSSFHSSSSLPPKDCSPPTRPLTSMEPQVFSRLGTSSPTKATPGSQSSAVYVPGASNQNLYVAWLVTQFLGISWGLG